MNAPERRESVPGIQTACDRCTQGVMDTRNPHSNGSCPCLCHERMSAEHADLYPAGALWRSWGLWRWTANVTDSAGVVVDQGKGWNLTERGARFGRNIWLHHQYAPPLDDVSPSGRQYPSSSTEAP